MVVYSILAFICSILYSFSAILCKYGLQSNINIRSLSFNQLISFLIRNKLWVIGVALSGVANIAMIQIQSKLDVSIVYSILNFSYVFVLILGHYLLKEQLNRSQWLGVGTVILGTALILSIKENSTGHTTDIDNLRLLTAFSLVTIIALIFTAIKFKTINYEILFAICTGICFGCVEIYLKTNTNMVQQEIGYFSVLSMESVIQFLSIWSFVLMFLYGGFGWLFLQFTYSHGDVSITVPLIAVTQRLVSMASGYFIFSEQFSTIRIFGIAGIILGVLILIYSSLNLKEPEPV